MLIFVSRPAYAKGRGPSHYAIEYDPAQGIEAGTDETPKSGSAAKPRKPDPKGCAHE